MRRSLGGGDGGGGRSRLRTVWRSAPHQGARGSKVGKRGARLIRSPRAPAGRPSASALLRRDAARGAGTGPQPPSRVPPLVRILIAAIVVCSVIDLEAREDELPVFEPDVEAAEGLNLQGETWTREDELFAIYLREIGQEERLKYIEGATGLTIDPFAAPPGEDPRFLSFLLVIENRGDAAFGFNALDCWLKTNREKIATPLGLTDLSFDYHMAGMELPPAYERITPLLLEGARTIIPGDSLSGLLVYRVVEPKTKRYHVDVDLIPPSGDIIRYRAPYRREKNADK